MRLFAALSVPEHVRTLVAAARQPARDAHPELSWSHPEGWHVTLAFLGTVDHERLGEVRAALGAGVRGRPIGLALGAAARLSNRVLWLEVADDPPGEVAALGARVQSALADAGLPVDAKPVRPHLTLARARRRGSRVTDAVVGSVAPAQGAWEVGAVHLYESQLGGRGPARYTSLGEWPLAG